MSEPESATTRDLLGVRDYRRFWMLRFFTVLGTQIQAITIGWQVYEIARHTHSVAESAFIVGMIGLAAFVPVFLLTLLAVPLSHVGPRQGRYGKVVLGVVVYLVYSNLIGLGQSWIAKGKIPDIVGLWWLHALVLATAIYLIGLRVNWWTRKAKLAAATLRPAA
mgnify:CR=1 FL=1